MAVIQIICPIICSFFRNLLTLHCQKMGNRARRERYILSGQMDCIRKCNNNCKIV